MASISLESIQDFLAPINKFAISGDEGYKETHLGQHIAANEGTLPDIENADLILVGCGDSRGAFAGKIDDETPNSIRTQFYGLYHWHENIQVADIGNVKSGATLNDTYAALQTVLKELIPTGKTIVILGGTHDLTSAQYEAYASSQKIINVTCIDARMDMDMDSPAPNDHFLIPIFTSEPNYVNRYNHIAFQSYMVHPQMLETIDKLNFDCYRVGVVKEKMEEMEPVIRDSDMLSFDIAAIQNAFAPANLLTPNGLDGEEACVLMQYAGMSTHLSTIGIYGHRQENDMNELTAKQISHMLWYLMDGLNKKKEEAELSDKDHFNEFNICFAEMDATFLQSRKTGRWWMQLPDHSFTPCSKEDYVLAAHNEIPERWLRAIQRL